MLWLSLKAKVKFEPPTRVHRRPLDWASSAIGAILWRVCWKKIAITGGMCGSQRVGLNQECAQELAAHTHLLFCLAWEFGRETALLGQG